MQNLDGWAAEFDLDPKRSWLNSAHQGAIPRVAAEAARQAVDWKLRPQELTAERFASVPGRLRAALAEQISARPEDLFLSNGASHGLHLIANGMPLKRGDDVLLMDGDFPSNILPWLRRRDEGVSVRLLRPEGAVLEVDEIERALKRSTRLLCISWVHSFSGWAIEIEKIGELCRSRGVAFVVNGTQAIGQRACDLRKLPIDALVGAGWKWLCGPYGVGFGWLDDAFRRKLRPPQRYWLSQQTAEDLARAVDPTTVDPVDSARRFDLFATANFFNFHAWAAAVELINRIGVDAITRHTQALVDQFVQGLDQRYQLFSPREANARRSSLILFSLEGDASGEETGRLYRELLQAGFDVAHRQGKIRVSPHLYNDRQTIERLLGFLGRFR